MTNRLFFLFIIFLFLPNIIHSQINKDGIPEEEGENRSLREDIRNISLLVTNNVVPAEFALYQNYPNPRLPVWFCLGGQAFNPTTEIRYAIPEISRVRLSVFDVLGREVAVLFTGIQEAGNHNQRWTPENGGVILSSGIYFYKLDASPVNNPGRRVTEIKKMLFVQ